MSEEKTKIIRSQIRDLIVTAEEQGIPFSSLRKIMAEEMQQIRQEHFEERVKRSEVERTFREKAIKMLDMVKKDRHLTGHYPRMLKTTRQRDNCLEILCVFYTKGIDSKSEIYTELERRLQVKREAIDYSVKNLYNFIAKYYDYDSIQFRQNDKLKKEKLQEFMKEIEKLI